jgi:hypothetical protein
VRPAFADTSAPARVALALPDPIRSTPDAAVAVPQNPPPPGTVFPRDDNGFIQATPDGVVTPDGVTVFAGRPPFEPPARPGTDAPAAISEGTADAAPEEPASAGAVTLATLRPLIRPGALVPETAAAAPPPPGDPALAGVRPIARPDGLAPPQSATPEAVAEAVATAAVPAPAAPPAPGSDVAAIAAAIAAAAPNVVNPLAGATRQAVVAAPRPDARPQNFARVVSAARTAAPAPAPQVAATAVAPAPQVASPTGPVPGGVARAATLENVINLRQLNLIGVSGPSNARTAIVRASNGRILRVRVGDSLDGGQVVAIGENALNYVKRGRTYTLVIPG